PHHLHLHSFPTRRSSDLTPSLATRNATLKPVSAAMTTSLPACHRLMTCYPLAPAAKTSAIARPRARQHNVAVRPDLRRFLLDAGDRKSTRLNSSHVAISY